MARFILGLFAATCSGVETALIACDEGGDGGLWHILSLVVNILTIGIGIAGLIGITVFGVQYLTAGGDVGKTTKAKNRMLNIVMGLVAFVLLWAGVQWLLPGGLFAEPDDVTDVAIALKSDSIEVGQRVFAEVTITPVDVVDKSYSIVSSDEKIASVTSNAITCNSEGNTELKVIAVNGKSKTINLTCKAKSQESDNTGDDDKGVDDNNTNDKPSGNSGNDNDKPSGHSDIDETKGLTYKQALNFAMNYGANKSNSSYKALSCEGASAGYPYNYHSDLMRSVSDENNKTACAKLWQKIGRTICTGGGLSNCVVLTNFFLGKFTSTQYQFANGNKVVSYLQNVKKGSQAKPFAVFSAGFGGTYGHTGVILGHHNGEWIVAHSDCFFTGSGKGNGTKGGNGSAFILKSSSLTEALYGMSDPVFAYPEVDLDALSNYLKTGE